MCTFFFAVTLSAQKKEIKFKSNFDLGMVDNWNGKPVIFTFTNTTNRDIRVFVSHWGNKAVDIEYPIKPVPPGADGEILVYCYPFEPGSFSHEIPIYLDEDAYLLKIKGKIKSFDPSYSPGCPGSIPQTPKVSKKEKECKDCPLSDFVEIPYNFKEQAIVVIDAQNKKFIKEPSIQVLDEIGNTDNFIAKENGMLKLRLKHGKYSIKVRKEGYQYKEVLAQFNDTTDELIVLLDRTGQQNEEEVWAYKEDKPRKEKEDKPAKRKSSTEFFFESEVDKARQERYAREKKELLDQRRENRLDRKAEKERERAEERRNEQFYVEESDYLSPELYKANNIVFLLDVSKSMEQNNKLPVLKNSMKRLTAVLRDIDKVTVIAYSNRAEVILPGIRSDNKEQIFDALDQLEAGGGTRGIVGIETAYQYIENNYIKDGNNQIILATDGEFKETGSDMKKINSMIRKNMRKGILLSVIGFGQNPDASKVMKRLAYSGKGNYVNILPHTNVETILVNEIKTNSARF